MKQNKGITIVSLIITIAVLFIITAICICLIQYDTDLKESTNNTVNTIQESCEHEWVIKSTYNWILKSYKTYSVCSKCGKEIR